jgi:AbrB family looped-hinge helix DNA binding protein
MLTARVSSKGQVVLPKRIRDELKIHEGSLFQVAHDGKRIILVPLKKSAQERLYGKYRTESLLEAMEIDHAEDLSRETNP